MGHIFLLHQTVYTGSEALRGGYEGRLFEVCLRGNAEGETKTNYIIKHLRELFCVRSAQFVMP